MFFLHVTTSFDCFVQEKFAHGESLPIFLLGDKNCVFNMTAAMVPQKAYGQFVDEFPLRNTVLGSFKFFSVVIHLQFSENGGSLLSSACESQYELNKNIPVILSSIAQTGPFESFFFLIHS